MVLQNFACEHCAERKGRAFAHDITMAFQPIFDLESGGVFAHEALLRGSDGRSAGEMLTLVDDESLYNFDQTCRVTAIRLAAKLGMKDALSINFMPNAVYDPATCIRRTLWAADAYEFPIENIVFEFTEVERVRDKDHLKSIVSTYKSMGFRTAIDDFGAGYSGLSLIADVIPDIVKIDREIVSGIDRDGTRRTIVAAMHEMCRDLGISVVAEGIETLGEMSMLRELGITLVQGYLLARPQFEAIQTRPDIPL